MNKISSCPGRSALLRIASVSTIALVSTLALASTMVLPALAADYSIAGANPLVARKDWNALLEYTRGWTRAKPSDPMAWYYLGQTYGTGFNQPGEAAQAFRRAVALKDAWPEAWHALAVTAMQSKQFEDSVKASRKAIALAPDRPNYWNTLAATYSWAGDWKETLDTLHEEEKHMARATSYDWYNLANALSDQNAYREAVEAYNRSIRMKPDFADAWNNLGVAQQSLGNRNAAIEAYRRAANLGDAVSAGNVSKLQQTTSAAPRPGSGSPHMICLPPSGGYNSSVQPFNCIWRD